MRLAVIQDPATSPNALLSGPVDDLRHLLALAKETLLDRLERGDTITQSMDDIKVIHSIERGLSIP